MHLLKIESGTIDDGSAAIDLAQTPGDIVFLSAADTELHALALARAGLPPGFPKLRLANLLKLQNRLSVDLYVETIVAKAKLVIVRLLGGEAYWRYGLEQIESVCRDRNIPFAFLPGDDRPEPVFARLSTVTSETYRRLWSYLAFGGAGNAANFLRLAAQTIGADKNGAVPEPRLLPSAGFYWPGLANPSLSDIAARWPHDTNGIALIVFYRALALSGALQPVDALIDALTKAGLAPLPVYVQSLKDPAASALLREMFTHVPAYIVLNCTAFATSIPGEARTPSVLEHADCPILQVVFAGQSVEAWRDSARGLSARDVAMQVALPEVDGRVFTRAVAFKREQIFDSLTECPITVHAPVPDRIAFVAEQAASWVRLGKTEAKDRRVALIFANYPNRDGRLGNGVGLDTPESAVTILNHLAASGYATGPLPADGQSLMQRLSSAPTNALSGRSKRKLGVLFSLSDYNAFFAGLPQAVQDAVTARWGAAADDPHVEKGNFRLAVTLFGSVALCVQPARGYNIDPAATYHDPALPPPHHYLAFYAWLRRGFGAHAVVHLGKHGNLEWLPGKALGLSDSCFPEIALGPLPHLYPFIVNDPGEGTQAKRRASAVIIDHLTPPLTRAESYGPLKDLEVLVDEYYEAAQYDPRRLPRLKREIVDLAAHSGLAKDCGIADAADADRSIAALDNYLCELKELQIRDGLHIFGRSPGGEQLTDLLVALVRVPRGAGGGSNASLLRALCRDLDLGAFDPLNTVMGDAWTGPRPNLLDEISPSPWRTRGDTVERLEALARVFVAGSAPQEDWRATRAVLNFIDTELRPAVLACGERELRALERGLSGRFVAPGPSGAPTRGRPEVLPTGRNFYSLDPRGVPTQTAWALGAKSAELLFADYAQRHGEPLRAVAISAWGTSNMRSGGDDIAQGLALIGVRPQWDNSSGRVIGFEILPLAKLGRPRVDVTFRISGFFRDAFPAQIALFDSALQAVMALDEPDDDNPLAARYRRECAELVATGMEPKEAGRRASLRIFGSKPGAYGAGLQALLDEGLWRDRGDLADAYMVWGSYAYGADKDGAYDREIFSARLKRVDAVVQNQDNREHDLLDSDDYYQFEGGIANAVAALKGADPVIYHNDHSRPETPRIRTLEDELARIVRGRAANPKWIGGVMRHGYKGAFEMAATVDYLAAFAATTKAVKDHHFDLLYAAYIDDETVLDFLKANNPAALKEMAARFADALARGLWKPRGNRVRENLERLIGEKPR